MRRNGSVDDRERSDRLASYHSGSDLRVAGLQDHTTSPTNKGLKHIFDQVLASNTDNGEKYFEDTLVQKKY